MCSSRKVALEQTSGYRITSLHQVEHNGKGNYADRSGTAGSERVEIPTISEVTEKELIYELIWFFLAGFIAGAVGMVLFARWWIQKHIKRVTPDEALRDLEHLRQSKEWEEIRNDGDGVQPGGGRKAE